MWNFSLDSSRFELWKMDKWCSSVFIQIDHLMNSSISGLYQPCFLGPRAGGGALASLSRLPIVPEEREAEEGTSLVAKWKTKPPAIACMDTLDMHHLSLL
jgi:hypothetical protein